MTRTDPRVFARPFELHRGQSLTERQLIDRLNDLGYAHRPAPSSPANSRSAATRMVLIPRDGDHKGQVVRLVFGGRPPKTAEPTRIDAIELPAAQEDRRPHHARRAAHHRARHRRPREAPRRAAAGHPAADDPGGAGDRGSPLLRPSGHRSDRHRRRRSSATSSATRPTWRAAAPHAAAGQEHVPDAGEDAEAQDDRVVHVGRARDAAVEGPDPPALSERRRRSASAARSRFTASPKRPGCSSRRTSPTSTSAEAATIAGVIQSPSRLSPFNNPERAKERRNVVLRAMADTGFISAERADRAVREPLQHRRAGARSRGALLRRLHQPGAAGEIPGRRHRRRLHDARRPPAADRAGRAARRADQARRDPGAAQAPAAGGADRHRSAHRRGPRLRRRPLLQPVAIQPRRQRAPAAGIGVQAVRLPRGVRARAGGRADRPDAGDRDPRRADVVRVQRADLDARATTTANTTARSRCGARWRCRATSPRPRWPRRPATKRSPRCGAGSAPARRRGRIRRSRSACSKPRRSRSPPRTRCSRTAARSAR